MNNLKTLYGAALIVFSLSTIGILVLFSQNEESLPPFIHQTFLAICQSGIVAAIMMVTIELMFRNSQDKATRTLIENINKNLFFAVYKRSILPGVVKEIEQTIFESNVFRTQHELCYNINPVDYQLDKKTDSINHVTCIITTSYKLKNISTENISHPIKTFLELPIDNHWHNQCKFESMRIGSDCVPDILNKVTTTATHKVLTHYIDLKPGEEIDISTKAQLIKRSTDMEIWTSRIPSDGMRLEVITPSGDIHASAHANHRLGLKDGNNSGNTKKEWKLEGYILPHQSVVFWWKTNDNQVNST